MRLMKNGWRKRGRGQEKKERGKREVRKHRCGSLFFFLHNISVHNHVKLHTILKLPKQQTWLSAVTDNGCEVFALLDHISAVRECRCDPPPC